MLRWLRGLAVLLLCLLVVAVGVLGGIGWYYSNQLLNVAHDADPYDLTVRAARAGTVTLDRTVDTLRPGVYGLEWHGGGGVLGAVTATGATTVTRRIRTDEPPPAGTAAGLDTSVWLADPLTARGLPYSEVRVPDPLGPMPAWFIPGAASRRTWVVAVHGRAASRREALRILPTLHRLGLPVLDITYRNDAGAPRSPDGLYHLGDTEWQDVEAAVRYAVAHGARRVVLYGWSMGGAIVEAFLTRSAYAGRVPAVVLDAPVLDWRATLALQGANRHLPGFLTPVAEQVVTWRIGIDWNDFDLDDHPDRVRVPTLIFHGEADDTVPIAPARRLAARSRLVTLVAVPRAGHTQSWNVAPAPYERRVRAFLAPYAR